MLKIVFICFAVLQATTCNRPVQSNSSSKPMSNAIKNATVNTAPTPPLETSLSECSQKRAQGLPAGVNIPQELCFDAAKPVDAKERSDAKVGNSPQSATIEEVDTTFDKLPVEVQKIIKITVPDIDTNAVVFDLTIIPTPDEQAKNRLVKSYSYSSSSAGKATGKDANHHTWLFKRQNNLLKLEFAEIDTTK